MRNYLENLTLFLPNIKSLFLQTVSFGMVMTGKTEKTISNPIEIFGFEKLKVT